MNQVLARKPVLRSLVLALALAVCAAAAGQKNDGLVAVMGIAREIAPVEARIQGGRTERIQGVTFTFGTIDGARIVAVRSGAGKVNAAMAATILVDHFSPAALVWTGTAGAIDPELNPADVLIGASVGYHDFGTLSAGGLNREATRNMVSGALDPLLFPAAPGLLAAARRAAPAVKPSRRPGGEADPQPRIREGVIVTGDAFIANPARRIELRRDLKASAVEMEGAAVAQVCARSAVPLIVIRSITDHADGEAEHSYDRFVDTASRNAADFSIAVVREWRK